MKVLDDLEEVKAMLAYMNVTSMAMLDEGSTPSGQITFGGRILFDCIGEKLSEISRNIELHANVSDGK